MLRSVSRLRFAEFTLSEAEWARNDPNKRIYYVQLVLVVLKVSFARGQFGCVLSEVYPLL